MTRRFILLKESPELPKGVILVTERDSDEGEVYRPENKNTIKIKDTQMYYSKKTVESQPEWFEELVQVDVPKKHATRVIRFVKSLK